MTTGVSRHRTAAASGNRGTTEAEGRWDECTRSIQAAERGLEGRSLRIGGEDLDPDALGGIYQRHCFVSSTRTISQWRVTFILEFGPLAIREHRNSLFNTSSPSYGKSVPGHLRQVTTSRLVAQPAITVLDESHATVLTDIFLRKKP